MPDAGTFGRKRGFTGRVHQGQGFLEPFIKNQSKLKGYGWFGLALITLAEVNLIVQHSNHHPIANTISTWTTPICWWGYILFIDALIFKLKGDSLISSRRREFLFQIPLSVLFWLIFEVYNLHLKNWHYEGLSENPIILILGFFISFATIMPALFLTADLLETLGVFKRLRIAQLRISNRIIYGGITLGLLFTIAPLLFERDYAKYMFALLWVGFVFLIDPLVYCSGYTRPLLHRISRYSRCRWRAFWGLDHLLGNIMYSLA